MTKWPTVANAANIPAKKVAGSFDFPYNILPVLSNLLGWHSDIVSTLSRQTILMTFNLLPPFFAPLMPPFHGLKAGKAEGLPKKPACTGLHG